MSRSLLFSSMLWFGITIAAHAQTGCPSPLPTGYIKGPDSNRTDADQTFRSLEVNPQNANVAYVGSEGNGIFKTSDGGLTWQWLRNGIKFNVDRYPEIWDIAISERDTNFVYMAATDAPGPTQGFYPSAMAGMYRSVNHGNFWRQSNCGIDNAKAGLVWISGSTKDTIFCTVEGGHPSFTNPPQDYYKGGIYYSTDSAEHWTKAQTPIEADSMGYMRLFSHPRFMLTAILSKVGTRSEGFIKSTDHGKTWQFLASPLKGMILAEFDVSADLQTIIAVPRDSFFIFKSTDQGANWTRMDLPVSGMVKYFPNNNDTAFFAVGSSLYKTTAGFSNAFLGAAEYSLVGNFNNYIENVCFAKSNPNIVYLVTRHLRVFKSTDHGNTFTFMANLRDYIEANAHLGFNQTNNLKDFSVFPNPSKNELHILNLKNAKAVDISLYNIQGELMINQTLSEIETTLNTSTLPSGIYFLKVKTEEKSFVEKIIVE